MIYAVILAAGSSTRMDGKPKALLRDSQNQTYLSRIAVHAREGGVGGVLVVVGPPHGDAVKKALPPGVAAAVNPRPDRGMLSSVQSGINAVPPGCTGVLVWPVDVPFVKATTVRAVVNVPGAKLVVPTHQGKGGHPLRIPRQLFAEVMALDGEGGLKALLDARPGSVERLVVDDAGVVIDVDTPADAAEAEARAAGTPAPSKKK
jgi:CTP:molybdopterin cytidylyltransferase MocA